MIKIYDISQKEINTINSQLGASAILEKHQNEINGYDVILSPTVSICADQQRTYVNLVHRNADYFLYNGNYQKIEIW